MISRRTMIQNSAGLVAAAGLTPLLGGAAWAQAGNADIEKLKVAGPLGEQALGDPDAPVTVVEYASMTCGHCANFHNNTYTPFKEKYIETGQVYFIFREFPLDPVATAVAMLARCAPEGKFFDTVEIFFERQREWASSENVVAELQKIAFQLGFTQETFKECLTNQELLDGVNWVRKRADQEFKVSSTPTFFFNGARQIGSMTIEEVDAVIQPML
uniref:DsbA family protein n=1 Tax=Pararhizobium sp. IMCC3301 TaxID=3067904 RepID=UPI00274223F3|nr:DsbA family protein [Pararhizobium sp. IMCC3301]